MITLLETRYTMTLTEHEARDLCNELGDLLDAAEGGCKRQFKVQRAREVYKLLHAQLLAKATHAL